MPVWTQNVEEESRAWFAWSVVFCTLQYMKPVSYQKGNPVPVKMYESSGVLSYGLKIYFSNVCTFLPEPGTISPLVP